jgi:hypothetical protein
MSCHWSDTHYPAYANIVNYYSVGVLKYVKQHCTPQIKTYDTCLQENSNEPEKCIQALKELYFCTEVTAMNYRQSQQPPAATTPAAEVKTDDKK